jgi:hypothetical protein
VTDLTKLRAELRAGLDGVTPGPWEVGEGFRIVFDNDEARGVIAECWIYDSPYEDLHAKAAHIARCSPENIRALLDALDDAMRERDEARAALATALDSAPILAKFDTKFGFDLEDFIAHYDEWKDKVRAIRDRTP